MCRLTWMLQSSNSPIIVPVCLVAKACFITKYQETLHFCNKNTTLLMYVKFTRNLQIHCTGAVLKDIDCCHESDNLILKMQSSQIDTRRDLSLRFRTQCIASVCYRAWGGTLLWNCPASPSICCCIWNVFLLIITISVKSATWQEISKRCFWHCALQRYIVK